MIHRKWMLAAASGLLAASAAAAQETPELKTDKAKFSYALGMNFGENFRKQGLELDPTVFTKPIAGTVHREVSMSQEQLELAIVRCHVERHFDFPPRPVEVCVPGRV